MKETELKPCPFCGGKATIINAQQPFERIRKCFATCTVCGVEMPRTARSVKATTKDWNRRTTDAYINNMTIHIGTVREIESIGVEIEVTKTIKRVNTIIVNGVEFVRKGATDNVQKEEKA